MSDFVFLSYSRMDKGFADRLVSDLQANGVRVWRDTVEILPGQNWQRQIEAAIVSIHSVLFVASRHSVGSGWIRNELEIVRESPGRLVVPLILDDVGANELPAFLKSTQWVDFREDYGTSLAALLNALPSSTRAPSPVPASVPKTKGYVFLSYADEDGTFVEALKEFLSTHDYAYWDYEESARDYHTQLFLELEHAIVESAAVLCVISPSWKTSRWAHKEYFFAEESGIPAFLVKAKAVGPILAIAGIPYIDCSKNLEQGLQKLHRELDRKGL